MTTAKQQNNNINKNIMRIKWAKSFSPAGRVQKRPSPAKPKTKPKTKPLHHTKADAGGHPHPQLFSGVTNRKSEIRRLETELAYSLDTLGTISVMYNSILHAYKASKSEMDRTRCATRLGEMEKELLTAYDDLALQVKHLQCRIEKIDQRLRELNGEAAVSSSSSPQPSLMSDGGGNESPLSALSYDATPPTIMWSDEIMLMGCSPTPPYQQQGQQLPLPYYYYYHHNHPPSLIYQQPHLLVPPWNSMCNNNYYQS